MLTTALIYLCAAIISVPIAKRIGLGSVLGYLLAGVIIGPYALKFVGDQGKIIHFAEFGVVMMLFLIGLELRPGRLWQMRRPILGLGGLQVGITAVIITLSVLLFAGLPWQSSVALGLALALSSTAIVLQSLTERGLLNSQAGNNAFSVLLFQDIAVIPILAMLPLLALAEVSGGHHDEHHTNLIADLPMLAQFGVSILTIAVIIVGGHYLAAPIFRFIAETHIREIFTAFALFIVVAIAVLMQSIGLSPALGTFLAGVVLADSEFRHELEVDIEPFKGLLLGLFFIAIGASINFDLLLEQPITIFALVTALILVKAMVLAFLARLFKLGFSQGLLFTLALAQGGEFAFVVVSAAKQFSVFDTQTSNYITLVVALSMLISPLLLVAYEAFMSRPSQNSDQEDKKEDMDMPSGEVIVAGYGRFGQIVGRLLRAQGYTVTILDHSPSQVELVRRFGSKVYYGDASRRDLLHAAGAERAKLLVIAVDEADKTIEIVKTAQKHFPNLKILARAVDRRHTYELMRLDIEGIKRETFDSALNMGVDALKIMGKDPASAERAGKIFHDYDEQSLVQLAEVWGDDHSYGVAIRQRIEDLKHVLDADQEEQEESKTGGVSEAEQT